jgi:hypothetical protein
MCLPLKLGKDKFCFISDGAVDRYWREIAHRVESRNDFSETL